MHQKALGHPTAIFGKISVRKTILENTFNNAMLSGFELYPRWAPLKAL